MDIGDIAYLVFSGIFGLANFVRQRNKRQQEEAKRPAPSPVKRKPEPSRNQEMREFQPENKRPEPPPYERSRPEEDPVKKMLEQMFGQQEEEVQENKPIPAPRTSPAAPKPVVRQKAPMSSSRKRPVVPVAEGYREGEDFRQYAERTRNQSRKKLEPLKDFHGKKSGKAKPSFRFNLKDAVIYDAIMRRPYQ